MTQFIRKNSLLYITLAAFLLVFIAAGQGMERKDFVITLLRGLSVGSLTFLVASGFSLIFGLLDVLNLAHGTLFQFVPILRSLVGEGLDQTHVPFCRQ